MPETNNPGNQGGTGAPQGGTIPPTAPAPKQADGANPPAPNNGNGTAKTFTQEQLDEIIKDRLDKQEKSFLKKLGVDNFEDIGKEIANGKLARQELLLSKNNIAEGRYDDVLTHFKGKGQELTDESLKEVVKTHPEWVKPAPAPDKKGFIDIGHPEHKEDGKSDVDELNKLFGTHIGSNTKHSI